MCKNNTRTIARVKNGTLTKCEACNNYHLTFNNLYFEFTYEEFKNFKTYLTTLKSESFKQVNSSKTKQKIYIPTLQENLGLVFNITELKALISLVSNNNKSELLDVNEIDYTLVLN